LKRAEESAAEQAKAKVRRNQKARNATQEVVEATTSADTVKHGRKRKNTVLEAEVISGDVRAGPSMPRGKVARVSNVKAAEATGVP
jgi:hypothetical protein